MRQAIIALSLSGSLIVYTLTIHFFDTFVMFVLFGILPGREQPLSANQMLAIYGAASLIVLAYALRFTLTGLVRVNRLKRTIHAS